MLYPVTGSAELTGAFQLRSTSCEAAVPVPFRLITAVLPVDELLLMVSCPLAEPAAAGLNCTCRVTDWLGFRVIGKLPPMMEKPVPVMLAELMVREVVPVEVRVRDWVVVLLTVMLPKLRLDALRVNCGSAAVPVPLNVTWLVLPAVELLLIVSWPLAEPAAAGLNCTWTVRDWLGFRVTGKF